MKDMLKNYDKDKPENVKAFLLSLKAVFGTIGGSFVVNDHPYIGLAILAFGAGLDEYLRIKDWSK